jgi:hypothetical protein
MYGSKKKPIKMEELSNVWVGTWLRINRKNLFLKKCMSAKFLVKEIIEKNFRTSSVGKPFHQHCVYSGWPYGRG